MRKVSSLTEVLSETDFLLVEALEAEAPPSDLPPDFKEDTSDGSRSLFLFFLYCFTVGGQTGHSSSSRKTN